MVSCKQWWLHPVCPSCKSLLAIKSLKECELSSSEAEWVALSKPVKEVIVVIQILGSMKISFKLSIPVRVDNVVAIFMASNINTTSCTKHVDIRYKYVSEYVKDCIVKIIFVKSVENDNNILTQNLSAELHEKHSKKLVGKKLEKVSSFKNI